MAATNCGELHTALALLQGMMSCAQALQLTDASGFTAMDRLANLLWDAVVKPHNGWPNYLRSFFCQVCYCIFLISQYLDIEMLSILVDFVFRL